MQYPVNTRPKHAPYRESCPGAGNHISDLTPLDLPGIGILSRSQSTWVDTRVLCVTLCAVYATLGLMKRGRGMFEVGLLSQVFTIVQHGVSR